MPEVGEKVQLAIEEVAYRGPGIGRLDGLVVFVERVAPGELIEAQITRRRKNFAEATLLQVITPSSHRIPSCTLLPDGTIQPGCSYDFLDYPTEVEVKQQQLLGLLRHWPGVKEKALAPFPSPLPLNYRNKIILHAQRTGRDLATLGYFAADNRTVIDIPNCALARDAINFAWQAQRDEARRKLENGHSITLRWTPADGVQSWIDQAPTAAAFLTEESPGGQLKVPAGGFFQVNSEVGTALALQVKEWVAAAAAELGSHTLLDLYCGVGVFALNCATDSSSDIIGIESLHPAVVAARQNAKAWQRKATFHVARVEEAARNTFGLSEQSRTIAIVDPPRRGLDPTVTNAIAKSTIPHLIYVACDPATMARDLKRLEPHGYQIRSLRMFDMFPRTPHFESAVWLSRN